MTDQETAATDSEVQPLSLEDRVNMLEKTLAWLESELRRHVSLRREPEPPADAKEE